MDSVNNVPSYISQEVKSGLRICSEPDPNNFVNSSNKSYNNGNIKKNLAKSYR